MRPGRRLAILGALIAVTGGCSMVQDLGGNLAGSDASSIDDATAGADVGVGVDGASQDAGTDTGPDTIVGPDSGDATQDVAADAVVDATVDAAPDASDAGSDARDEASADAADGASPDAADGEAGPPATCSSGLISWARATPGYGVSVAPRAGGSAFVQGGFYGTRTATLADGGTVTLTATDRDVYLALYGADGTLAWIQGAGGAQNDSAGAVAVAPGGGAIWTGSFGDTSATFGAGQSNATTLTSIAGFSGFVASYDSAGALLWAKAMPGASDAMFAGTFPSGVGVAADGTSVVVGSLMNEPGVFGQGEPGETTLSLSAGVGIAGFMARYAADGHLIWAKAAQGAQTTQIMGFALAPDGSFYVTGNFGSSGTTVFGRGEPNETSFTSSSGGYDLFLAHYNADGTLAWAKRTPSSDPDAGGGGDIGRSVALAAEGAILVSGDLEGSKVFGPGEANQTAVSTSNGFVASFDPTGALRWVRHASGSGGTSGTSVAAVPGGGAAVTGGLHGSVTFGSGESHETTLSAVSDPAGYVARYESDGSLAWAKRMDSDGGTANPSGIASTADCTLFVTGALDFNGTFAVGETDQTTLTADNGAGFLLRMQP